MDQTTLLSTSNTARDTYGVFGHQAGLSALRDRPRYSLLLGKSCGPLEVATTARTRRPTPHDPTFVVSSPRIESGCHLDIRGTSMSSVLSPVIVKPMVSTIREPAVVLYRENCSSSTPRAAVTAHRHPPVQLGQQTDLVASNPPHPAAVCESPRTAQPVALRHPAPRGASGSQRLNRQTEVDFLLQRLDGAFRSSGTTDASDSRRSACNCSRAPRRVRAMVALRFSSNPRPDVTTVPG